MTRSSMQAPLVCRIFIFYFFLYTNLPSGRVHPSPPLFEQIQHEWGGFNPSPFVSTTTTLMLRLAVTTTTRPPLLLHQCQQQQQRLHLQLQQPTMTVMR